MGTAIVVSALAGAKFGITAFIAATVINLAIAAVLGKILAPSFNDSRNNSGMQETVRNPIMPRRIVYGETVTGGCIIYLETSADDNEVLTLIPAITGHPVEDILGVFLNDIYVNIASTPTAPYGSNNAANSLSSDWWVDEGAYGDPDPDVSTYHKARVVKNNGWGFADKKYVTDETLPEVLADQNRSDQMDVFITGRRPLSWSVPDVTNLTRDTGTGLYDNPGHKVTNCSHCYISFIYDEEVWRGVPSPRFHVKGKRLYNPAKDPALVAFGADAGGTHDLYDPDTWEWSEDWTLCVLDYLINPDFGLGSRASTVTSEIDNVLYNEIDWEEAISSYAISSQIVDNGLSTGDKFFGDGTGPRYTVNGVFECDATPVSIMESLLTSGAGSLVYSQGKYKIRPGAYRAPESLNDIINEDMIVGSISLQTHTPRADLFNKVTGTFINAYYDRDLPIAEDNMPEFTSDEFPLVNPLTNGVNLYEEEDGQELIREFDFPFTIYAFEAQRIAKIQLERVRRGIAVSFNATLEVLKYSVGDTVYLEILNDPKYSNEEWYNRLGLDDSVQTKPSTPFDLYYKQFLITSMEYNEDFTISVTMIEENSTIYDWNGGDASPDTGALGSETPIIVPSWPILPPTFVTPGDPIVEVSTATGIDTLVYFTTAISGGDFIDRAFINSYILEYGIVTTPGATASKDRVATWISAGIYTVSDRTLATQGPVSISNLYINSSTDFDFRVRSRASDGRLSGWVYYEDEILADWSPTEPGTAARYYIKPTDGTAIRDGVGTLTLEATMVDGSGESLLISGNKKLYVGTSEVVPPIGLTGSDGYTGIFGVDEISSSVVVELRDDTIGIVYDTITLVDLSDGINSTVSYIEIVGNQTWVQSDDLVGGWDPATTTTVVEATVVRGTTEVARRAVRIDLDQDTETLSQGTAPAHTGSDLDLPALTPTVTISADGRIATVKFDYVKAGFASSSVQEDIIIAGMGKGYRYIHATNGTAIKNGIDTLTIEARAAGSWKGDYLMDGTTNPLTKLRVAGVTVGDGYTATFAAADITGSVVVELERTDIAKVFDTITLVDILDGTSGVVGFIEATNGLAWQEDSAGTWLPAGNTTQLDVTFTQDGDHVARWAYLLTRDGDGNITGTTVGVTHSFGSNLDTPSITITPSGEGTKNVTVQFDYLSTPYASTVAENVFSVSDGTDGSSGSAALNVGRKMDRLDQWFDYTTGLAETDPPWSVATVNGPMGLLGMQHTSNTTSANSIKSEVLNIDPTKKYRVSFWAKQTGDSGSIPFVQFYDSAGTIIGSATSDATGWPGGIGSVSHNITAPAVFGASFTKYTLEFGGDAAATIPQSPLAATMVIAGSFVYTTTNSTTISIQDYHVVELSDDGSPGTSSRTVNLTAGQLAFAYLSNGTLNDNANTTVTATALNTSGTPWYRFYKNDVAFGPASATNTYTFTPDNTWDGIPDKIEVQLTEDSGSPPIYARDQITVLQLKPGVDAPQIVQTNEAHVVPADSPYAEGDHDYTGSENTIKVFLGTTELTYDDTVTYASPSFRITGAVGTGITAGSQTANAFGVVSAMSADTAYVTYTIVVRNTEGIDTTVTRVQSFSRAKQGTQGPQGDAAVQYYIKPINGTAIKNGTNTLEVRAHKITGGSDDPLTGGTIQLYDGTTAKGYTWATIGAGDITGDLLVELKDGPAGTVYDTITLVDIADGGNAVNGYIEASNGLASTRAADESTWTPAGNTTNLTVTFVQGGSTVGTASRLVTRNNSTGLLTTTADGTSGNITITRSGQSTAALTVEFAYNDGVGGVCTVAETVLTSMAGADGVDGAPGHGPIGAILLYDDADNSSGQAQGDGRYCFSTNLDPSIGGTITWTTITGGTIVALVINKDDQNAVDQSSYLDQVVVGDVITWYDSQRRWVEFRVTSIEATLSSGERYVFGISLVEFDEFDGTGDLPSAAANDIEFWFSRPSVSDGAKGLRTIQGYLYMEKATAPGTPPAAPSNADDVYTFSTGIVTGTDINTGASATDVWENAPREQDATSVNKFYTCRYYGTESAADSLTIDVLAYTNVVGHTEFSGVVRFINGTEIADGSTTYDPADDVNLKTTTINGGRITANSITANEIDATFYTGRTFQTRALGGTPTEPRVSMSTLGFSVQDLSDVNTFYVDPDDGHIEVGGVSVISDIDSTSITNTWSQAAIDAIQGRLGVVVVAPLTGGTYTDTTLPDTIGSNPTTDSPDSGVLSHVLGTPVTLSCKIEDSNFYVGPTNQNYTDPSYNVQFRYQDQTPTPGIWTDIGAPINLTGRSSNESEGAEQICSFSINATASTTHDPVTDDYKYSAVVTYSSGSSLNPRITQFSASEAIAGNATFDANQLTGTTLASNVVTSSLTTVGTIGTGVWQGTAINQAYLTGQSGTNTGDEPSASLTVPGIVELATSAETNAGTDATRAVTPDGLADWTGDTSITTLGTIGTGTWQGTTIAANQGGTGQSAYTVGDLLYANTTSTLTKLGAGSNGEVLKLAAGVPSWGSAVDGGDAVTEGMSTGLRTGGILSVNADTTKFDVAAGTGLVVDHSTSPPTVTEVSFGPFTAVPVANLATAFNTDIAINSAGAIQQATSFTNAQLREWIFLGGLDHNNKTTIDDAFPVTIPVKATMSGLRELARAVGDLNLDGNIYSANGANLSINKSAGTVFSFGRNFQIDVDDPHTLSTAADTLVTFGKVFNNGSGFGSFTGDGTTVDPNFYDNGTGTLAAVTANRWTIQRFLLFPNANKTFVQYGTAEYVREEEALDAIPRAQFVALGGIKTAMIRGYLVVQQGETNLTNATFLSADRLGTVASISAGIASTFDGLTDTDFTSLTTNDFVKYDGANWINTPLNIVEDVTPQLGGNLDMNGKYVTSTNHGRVGNSTLEVQFTLESEWANLPVGYGRMARNTTGTAGGAPVNNYGYFTKTANRDSGGGWGGIWVGYSAGENYMGRSSTNATFASWDKLWSDVNLSNKAQFNTACTDGTFLFSGDVLTAAEFKSTTNATQPWLSLDSTSAGDGWTAQGAGISAGENGKFGAAAIHMTYNGGGVGYVGMGAVDTTAGTGGRPAFSHLDFSYNTTKVRVGGRLFPGKAAANDTTALTASSLQSTAYIEDCSAQNYGSINVTGAVGTSGTYSGISVNRKLVMMHNGTATAGLYNDNNNQWVLQYTENAGTHLYYAGVKKLETVTGGVNVVGVLDASSYLTTPQVRTDAVNGNGIGFWGSAPTTYGHYMSIASTQGRIAGETTSDYNQYFEMNGGTNRGFVFESGSTKLFSINPDGIRSAVDLDVTGDITVTGTLTGTLRTLELRTSNGQQLVLNAGESNLYATGQTGEWLYVNAEQGLQINSSPDNWGSVWAGRNTAEICKADGTSTFPGNVTITGTLAATNAYVSNDLELGHTTDTTLSRISAGKVEVEGKPIIKHASATYNSGELYIQASDPGGVDGDLWFDTDATASIAAEDITAGNLGSGVLPYIASYDTGDTICPILFTLNSTAGSKAIYEDSAFYYNATANYLYFGNYLNGGGTFPVTASAITSGMGTFTGTNGTDNFGRGYTAAAARTLLNVANGATANAGTVTSVTAGAGMTQTGTSTVNPTLNVIASTGITVNTNNIAVTAAQTGITSIFNNALQVGYSTTGSRAVYASGVINYRFVTGTTADEFRMTSAGNFDADGNITAYSTTISSDERLKKDIDVFVAPLEMLKQLRGVEFTWKRDNVRSAGLIAQDVQKIIPQAVIEVDDLDNEGGTHLCLNYDSIVGLLVEAVKDLNAKVEELTKKLEDK